MENHQNMLNKKILVVDDVEMNQYLALHILESWGCIVELANNGSEAIDKIRKHEFDLVLMDIQMPVMDGIDATKSIRNMKDANKASIPIIALTANAANGDCSAYIDAGMNDYLPKPFDEPGLHQMILKCLNPGHTEISSGTVQQSVVAKPDANAKLYDLAVVEAISGGDLEFIKSMLELFLTTMPPSLNEIQEHFSKQNWDAVAKQAHKIKSTIDSMGIGSLKNEIRIIESIAKKGDNVKELDAPMQKLLSVMKECMLQVKKDYKL